MQSPNPQGKSLQELRTPLPDCLNCGYFKMRKCKGNIKTCVENDYYDFQQD